MSKVKELVGEWWYGAVHIFLLSVFGLFFRMKVTGKKNLPKKEGYIFAANHSSYLDPPIAGAVSPRKVNYMAKETLFAIPVLGPLIRTLGAFPVSRSANDTKALKHSIKLLKAGKVLGLFPEGRRSQEKIIEAKMGVALIMKQSGAPVIPVGISGANRAITFWGPIPLFHKITVRIGTPIQYTKTDGAVSDKENMRLFTDRLMEEIEELCLPENYGEESKTAKEGAAHS